MASPRRQTNARAQRRDARGRFSGPVERRPAGEVIEDAPAAPAAAEPVVGRIVYRQPAADSPVEEPASGDPPAPVTGEPAAGETPAVADDPPVATGDDERDGPHERPRGFLAGMMAAAGGRR